MTCPRCRSTRRGTTQNTPLDTQRIRSRPPSTTSPGFLSAVAGAAATGVGCSDLTRSDAPRFLLRFLSMATSARFGAVFAAERRVAEDFLAAAAALLRVFGNRVAIDRVSIILLWVCVCLFVGVAASASKREPPKTNLRKTASSVGDGRDPPSRHSKQPRHGFAQCCTAGTTRALRLCDAVTA